MTYQKKLPFSGCAAALVTPFCEDGVDYGAFGRLIDRAIREGCDALVVCGTTGETSTLSDDERRACIRFCVEHTARRVPVIAGTGCNATAYACALTQYADEVGADGALVVTPYYNRASEAGLVAHFRAVADASRLPVILYNIPGRTGVDLSMRVYRALAEHERIVAVKEASGNMSRAVELAAELGDTLALYSGNDELTLPMLAVGGRGVISAAANVIPREMSALCRAFFSGRTEKAARLAAAMQPILRALYCEVNPIPMKAALEAMGLCGGELRLPLCPLGEEKRAGLLTALKEAGLVS